MYLDFSKRLENFFAKCNKINKDSKILIKYGSIIASIIFLAGTAVFIYNRMDIGFDFQIEVTAISLIKSSFFILAEVIIGGLTFDYMQEG